MVSIVRAKFGIPITDIFFDCAASVADPRSSISFFVQSSAPQSGFVPFKTQIVDLTQPPGKIFSRISSNCRYKIKRAEREGCIPVLSAAPLPADVLRFSEYFDEFARQKRLPRANRAKLAALCDVGALLLSSVAQANGQPLAMHAYVLDSRIRRARLLYSASHFRGLEDSGVRNLIGRANRLLHWHEMEQLHHQQVRDYDFGGLPLHNRDEAKNAIARFKREFGGREVIEYNGLRAGSTFGKLLLLCRRRAA